MKTRLLAVLLGFFCTSATFGQSRSFSEKRGAQMMNVSIPIINLAGETTLHGEFNLGGEGGLALEIINKGHQEEALKSEQSTGTSRMAKAQGIAFIYSSYNEPLSMAGFYWGLGAGFRKEAIDWLKPGSTAENASLAATSPTYTSRLAELEGPTAHGRIGYRYVGKDWPLLIGVFGGLRHFASTVKNGEGMSSIRSDKNSPADTLTLAPVASTELSASEKDKLKNIYATRAEGGIEVGFSF